MFKSWLPLSRAFKNRPGRLALLARRMSTSAASMPDEYGSLDSSGETFTAKNFKLELGGVLPEAQLRYNTYGTLNAERDNVLIVCHALTGNSRLDLWWGGLLGPGKAFDTGKYFVLCANVLGSCYGSTGPRSLNPATSAPYGTSLPALTLRDTVRLQVLLLREQLRVTQVQSVVGGSMGGMQCLEWLVEAPGLVKTGVAIACNAYHSAWQIAVSEAQRQAIYCDAKWRGGEIDWNDPPVSGLAVARQMAMVSYRTPQAYHQKFSRLRSADTQQFEVQKYLHYQGQKFLDRFDALTYVTLTQIMDRHDLSLQRNGSVEEVLRGIAQPSLLLSMSSDLLYPPYEQDFLHQHMEKSALLRIDTFNGHDGFLLEQEEVSRAIKQFLDTHCRQTGV